MSALLEAFRESNLLIISNDGGLIAGALSLFWFQRCHRKDARMSKSRRLDSANLPNKQQAVQPNHDDAGEKSGTNQDDAGPKYGTGFFVSEKGHILTNNHVTEGCRNLVIHSPGGQQQDASVVKSDKSNDLALLLAPQHHNHWQNLSLRSI